MFLAEYGTFFWYFISTSSSTSKSTSTSTLNKLSTTNLSKTFSNQNDHNDDQMNTMNTIRLLSSWKTTRPIFFLIFCNEILLPFPKRLYSITCSTLVILLEIMITISWWPLYYTLVKAEETNSTTMSTTLSSISSSSSSTLLITSDAILSTMVNHTLNQMFQPLSSSSSSSSVLMNLSSTTSDPLIPLSIQTATTNTSWQYFYQWSQAIRYRGFYLLSDILFYLLAGLVAFYVTYLLEIVNRRAFLDHRKCVESKYKLTFERDEQERLLASCLPKHLMKKVRNDIRSRFTGNWSSSISSNRSMINNNNTVINVDGNNNNDNDEHRNQIHSTKSNIDHPHHHHHHHKSGSNGSIGRPFSEMYIDKYSNVTILYADIVNSMALTQTLQSPKALVEALNNLFCRFDCRAENHDCLRIKLLGDCYYCISGIPDDEDKRHAANCLRMGLDMLDIIKEYRHETGINVDMRIGIHTGMILSGLLGLKKWQFDIWSIDTMKASQMEQEGRPGFVHITMASLQQIPADILNNLLIIENHVLKNETTYLIQRKIVHKSNIENNNNMTKKIESSNYLIAKDQRSDCTTNSSLLSSSSVSSTTSSSIDPQLPHHHHHDHHNYQIDNDCQPCRPIRQVSIVEEDVFTTNTTTTTTTNSYQQSTYRHRNWSRQDSSRRRPMSEVINSLRNYGEMIRCSNDSLSQTIDKMSFNLKRQYDIKNSFLEINPIFLYFIHSQSQQQQQQNHHHPDQRRQSSISTTSSSSTATTSCLYDGECSDKSSSSKSIWNHLKRIHRIDLKRELKYLQQDDHLFPYYLIASLIITIMIIVIRFLTLYDYDYYSNNNNDDHWQRFFFTERGNWFCYMAIIVAIVSLIYTLTKHNHHHNHHNHNNQQKQKRQNQMICIEFRMLIWLLISTLLITSTIMDMSHCSMAQMQEIKIHQHNDNRTINTIGKECLYKWSRYYTYSSILAMSSISLFIRVNLWFKFALSTVALSTISLIIHLHPCSIFLRIDRFYQLPRNEHYDQQQQTLFEKNQQQFFGDLLTPTMSHLHYLFIVYLMFHVLDRQIEYISRLDFLWAHKLKRERREARLMREVNQLLLKNILPIHVAQKFLTNPEQANSLYYEPYDSCAVMFAAIPNFFRFYTETKDNDDGLQYLYILNDIICEFDKLLILPQFKRRIEKIKTIGSTYMAAAGLQPGRASIDSSITTKQEVTNLVIMIRFALSMMRVLNRLNSIPRDEQTVNQCLTADQHFQLRIGISMGPVIAGVVGAIKPQYDIWGDTVNVASRMDTYGVVNKIQIPDYVAKVLIDHQLFRPYSRGIQEVKGKGKLETFLIDYNEHDCME
uniref:adenylate cyclase n=1 Tax=Dermatophagoides pteronyssinus TaxID=6956 RepID=A0A6P6Y671_DERPT|nr:adenylate cyclase type 8-like [Dermatophagoides pteronyssinus]